MRAGGDDTDVIEEAGHQITSSAPSLTETPAGLSLIFAGPVESSIPDASNFNVSGIGNTGGPPSSVMLPPPGRSSIFSVTPSVFHTFVVGSAGETGTSFVPQKKPPQIG